MGLDPYSTIFAQRNGVDFAPWLGARRARASERLRERVLMPLHHNRRATPPGGKNGLPLRGRFQKSAELRRLLARSPATRLRCTPRQRISESDHAVQMWSNTGLAGDLPHKQ